MAELIKILINALPEAIGGLIAAGVLTLLSYLFVKKFKKPLPQSEHPIPIITEPPKPEIPSNLPPRSAFVGREKEKQLVKDALNSRWPLICIDGIGGIGKTSLTLEVVSECLDASKNKLEEKERIESDIPFFDGFIWSSAKDRELKLNDVLDAVARTLDWPGIAQQPVEEKSESVRKLLQTKRYLLVLDNFETITDGSIRDFLLKLPEPSKALITSREQKLPQAWMVSIKGLEQNEALILIRNEGQRLGLKSIENAEDQVLIHLYQATGGAPLAIKWATGQIKQKGQSLDTVLSALHEAKGDIFEEVFAQSWSLLTEDAKKVLMVMPTFASSASKDAIEAVSDVHHFALDEALGQLVQMWLVDVTDELEAAKRRYNMHPLTRAFAEAKLKMDDNNEKAIKQRNINYYIELVRQYKGHHLELYDLLEIEKDNIISAINFCYTTKQWQNTLGLIRGIIHFLGVRGYWQERIQLGEIGVEVAERIEAKNFSSWLLVNALGWVHLQQGDYINAKVLIEQGIVKAFEAEEFKIAASGKRNLGWIAREEGNLEAANLLTEEASELARHVNYKELINSLYSDFGELYLEVGKYKEAESCFKKSIDGFEDIGAKERIAKRFVLLGEVLLLQNKINESHQAYQESLILNQKYKRQDIIARAKLGLAKLNEKSGNFNEAKNLVNEAYILFQKLGMKKYIKEAEELIERLMIRLH